MTHLQTAAILFADIAGSSRLYKELGDTRAQEIIASALREMMTVTLDYGGRVVKTIGDEVMASFPTAEAGILAAMAMQSDRADSEPRTDVRIGVHFGPVLRQGDDVFGEAVNDAAFLVKIAQAGQIISSSDTVLELPDHLRARAHRFDRVQLKGASESTLIYRLEWEEEGGTMGSLSTQVISALVDEDAASEPARTRLELAYADRRIVVTPESGRFVVGRDSRMAALPILSEVASRHHFHIEFRRGKFVLADSSTNGTWVQIAGQDPIYLRREEVALTGTGIISVGQEIEKGDPHLIHFST